MAEPLPKRHRELRAAVRDDAVRESVQPEDVLDEQVRQSGTVDDGMAENEVVGLRQAVCYCLDGIAALGPGQAHNKVHSAPGLFEDRKRTAFPADGVPGAPWASALAATARL